MEINSFSWGLIGGMLIGYGYWLLGRYLSEKNLVQAAEAGLPTFVHGEFYYLVSAQTYIDKGLYMLLPPAGCPHGFIENWSDDCPDCRH